MDGELARDPGGGDTVGTRAVEAARARLAAGHAAAKRTSVVIERAALDRWIQDAAPPGVPYAAVVLSTSALATRFGDGPLDRRSRHMHGKTKMTHRAIPSEAVVVLVLFSDVAADYFVETMAADVAADVIHAHGADLAFLDAQSSDRLIAGDFFGARRDHMCRACITRCPVSNDVLKVRREEGAPNRTFWDNEGQLSLVADLFMYRTRCSRSTSPPAA